MVQRWAPEGYVVSFKLETDEDLLIPKARTALERYGHQVVVGNELNKRKYEVVFVERDTNGQFSEHWIRIEQPKAGDSNIGSGLGKGGEREIEEDIVRALAEKHERWIEGNTKAASGQ